MSPRHIRAIHIDQIGKESNQLEEIAAGLIHDPADLYTTYASKTRDTWTRLVLPVLQNMPRQRLAEQTGISLSAIAEALAGTSSAHAGSRRKLTRAAHQHASTTLAERNQPVPRNTTALLHACLETLDGQAHACCPVCDESLLKPGAIYCGSACKQKAYRQRHERA